VGLVQHQRQSFGFDEVAGCMRTPRLVNGSSLVTSATRALEIPRLEAPRWPPAKDRFDGVVIWNKLRFA